MSETVNTTTIQVVADASGVEATLGPVNDAVAKTGKNLDNLGAIAERTAVTIGAVGQAATRMIDAVNLAAEATSALSAGAKGAAEHLADLANIRKIDPDALKPFLSQLDEMVQKAASAAEGQRKLDDATKFLNDLRSRAEGIGKSASALAELRAAQLGVSESAAPMIAKLREAEEAAKAGPSVFEQMKHKLANLRTVLIDLAIQFAKALPGAVYDAIDDLAKLDDMSKKTGASVEKLSKIQKIGIANDMDTGAIEGALVKLSSGMAGVGIDADKTKRALSALGVSWQEGGGLRDSADVFVDVANKLEEYNDGAAKTALMNDLIKDSGAGMLPLMNSLAEDFDSVSGVSRDAVKSAADFQGQLGKLKLEVHELFTKVAIDALPALNDLVGAFLDVYKGQGDLDKGGGREWADAIGLGIAKAADSAVLLGRGLALVWNSVKAVWADLKFVFTLAGNFNPITGAFKWATGGSALSDIKAALAERNKSVEDANNYMEEVLARPIDEFTNKYLEKQKKRSEQAQAPAAASVTPPKPKPKPKPKRDLNYSTGNPAVAKSTRIQKAVEAVSSTEDKSAADRKTQSDQLIDAATKEAEKNEELAKTYGLSRAALAALEVQRLEETLSRAASTEMTAAEIENLEKLIAVKKRGAAAINRLDDLDATKKAAEDLDKFLDPSQPQKFGEALHKAFGAAGESVIKLTGAMQDLGSKQAEIEKQRGNAALLFLNGKKSEAEYQANIDELNKRATKNQLAGYGDMASAAAGFFGEHSRGYQAMMAVSQAFHAAEFAMTTAELVPKAISAVLTQGNGDPYTAFGRMAAMAAIVAGLGVAIGGAGGGSDTTSKDRQAAQGAGTVLGDSSAKSNSIARAVELSASNSSTQIDYLSGMLMSLRTIEAGISSFASQIVSGTDIGNPKVTLNTNNGLGTTLASAGMTLGGAAIGTYLGMGSFMSTGAAIGGPLGLAAGALLGYLASKSSLVGKVATSIFGGKQSVEDSGFTMDRASLASILAAGAKASQYADVKTSGGWFRSDKRSTQLTSLGVEANAQFSLILESMADAIGEAGKLIGVSGAGFEARLNSFVVDIGKVSLKGMSGDEIQKALESVFSKLGDQMASFAVGGLQSFQKVGEGYLETLVRVASDYAKVDASLQSINKTFGATGIASIKAREDLIALMGGIDEFQSQTAGFANNFLTEAERIAPVAKYVDEQLAALGLSGITTRDQFKQVVLGLDLTSAAGQKEYAALMSLQEAFAATHAATVDLSESEQEITDEKKGLQDQLDQLTMTQTQLLQKQRYALAEANRPLFDMVQAAQKLADSESGMVKFRDAAKSLNDSLLTGSLSTLTPEQQYTALRDQYEKTKAAALAGDTKAQDDVFNALNAWLTASQKLNSGDAQYQADFALARQDSASMASWASKQVDVAHAQLDAMNSQTLALGTVNTALETVTRILDTISQNTSPVISPANVLGSALSVLGSAVKSLQENNARLTDEVAGLRKDQQVQTGDTITSNAEVQQSAAEIIVSGVSQAVARMASSNQKVTLE